MNPRKWLFLLLALLAACGGAALALLLAASRPLTALVHRPPGVESARIREVRRALEPLYARILDAISAGSPAKLSGIPVPAFVYETLSQDRVYELNLAEWEADLRRFGQRISLLPAYVTPTALQLERRRSSRLEIGRIELAGDRAVVDIALHYVYGRTRLPARTQFEIRQDTFTRDTWQKQGGAWRLIRIRALKVSQVRESLREDR